MVNTKTFKSNLLISGACYNAGNWKNTYSEYKLIRTTHSHMISSKSSVCPKTSKVKSFKILSVSTTAHTMYTHYNTKCKLRYVSFGIIDPEK